MKTILKNVFQKSLMKSSGLTYIASLKINLIKKIKLINTCTSAIILKTETLIEKIHKSSMRIIQTLKAKEQYYISLMNISNGKLSIEERKKFQREFNTYIVIRMPDQNIEKFYTFDFLKVIEKTNKFKSMKKHDFKLLLRNEYKEFVAEFYTNDKYFPCPSESVTALTITSDSKYIVSADKDCALKIWNFRENRQEAILKSQMRSINKILVTSDSKYIIISSSLDRGLRIWNLEKKIEEEILPGYSEINSDFEISSDSKYIIYYDNYTIIVWNIPERKGVACFSGHYGLVVAVAITSDNKYIVSGSEDHTVRLWDVEKRRQEEVFRVTPVLLLL